MTAALVYAGYLLTLTVYAIWSLGCPCAMFGRRPPQRFRAARAEVAPFVAPAIVTQYLAYVVYRHMAEGATGIQVWAALFLAGQLWTWWRHRRHTDDDDRWRRRRRKTADLIRVAAGRLTVVPGGVS